VLADFHGKKNDLIGASQKKLFSTEDYYGLFDYYHGHLIIYRGACGGPWTPSPKP
jgi:hypothetical protein